MVICRCWISCAIPALPCRAGQVHLLLPCLIRPLQASKDEACPTGWRASSAFWMATSPVQCLKSDTKTPGSGAPCADSVVNKLHDPDEVDAAVLSVFCCSDALARVAPTCPGTRDFESPTGSCSDNFCATEQLWHCLKLHTGEVLLRLDASCS